MCVLWGRHRAMRDDTDHDALVPKLQRLLASLTREQRELIVVLARSICRAADTPVRRSSMFVALAEGDAGRVDDMARREARTALASRRRT
jgi:hypothetical protein